MWWEAGWQTEPRVQKWTGIREGCPEQEVPGGNLDEGQKLTDLQWNHGVWKEGNQGAWEAGTCKVSLGYCRV